MGKFLATSPPIGGYRGAIGGLREGEKKEKQRKEIEYNTCSTRSVERGKGGMDGKPSSVLIWKKFVARCLEVKTMNNIEIFSTLI